MPNSLLYLCCPSAERPATEALLGEAGVPTRWADDAPSALAALSRQPSVVIADFGDPRAASIVAEIKRARPSTFLLAVTDPSRPGVLAEIERVGIPAVLHRPLNARMVSALLGAVPDPRQRAEAAWGKGTSGTPIVARSAGMRRALEAAERAAASQAGVLVRGEDGSGRALLAREIHECSAGPGAPFVRVDCAPGPGGDVEAALFGTIAPPREMADRRRLDRVSADCALVAARGGTLFLAHLSDASERVQARLARVLRDGEVHVGDGKQAWPLDLRPVASASPRWDAAVAAGEVRDDLARRIAVSRVDVPPLRDRREDMPLLAAWLLDKVCRAQACGPKSLDPAALALIAALPWKGNGPELEAVMAAAAQAATGPAVTIDHVLASMTFDGAGRRPTPTGTLRDARDRFEREYITAVLERHRGRVPEAARALGLQRTNLYRKMRALKIAWRDKSGAAADPSGLTDR